MLLLLIVLLSFDETDDGLLDCFVASFVSPLMLIALLPPSIRIMGTSVVYDVDSKGRRKDTVTREEEERESTDDDDQLRFLDEVVVNCSFFLISPLMMMELTVATRNTILFPDVHGR